MRNGAAPQRLERKFLVEDLDVHEVESIVRLHPAAFRKLYAPRWINNIYFDSPGGSPYTALSLVSLLRLRNINATGIVTGECSSAAVAASALL